MYLNSCFREESVCVCLYGINLYVDCMDSVFTELLRKRRSFYSLENDINLSERDIISCLQDVLLYVPSAFNSQSTRLVLLMGNSHKLFWQTVCEKIEGMVSLADYNRSKTKIEKSFASGYGTLLFYEDKAIIAQMKKDFPLYAKDFNIYSEHTSAMHQFATWLLFSELGMGASLQHYGALVERDCVSLFDVPDDWRLVAQMPFGKALDVPGEKSQISMEERLRICY